MRRSPALKPTTSPSSSVVRHDVPLPHQGPAAGATLLLLRAYKVLLSPLFTGACRFYPSCSDYMAEAVQVHGAWKGAWLGLGRLGRCHPLCNHGADPVPPRFADK